MVRDSAATRERILDAAFRVTLDRGFASASLEQILAEAGVTKGAFFHHFASKAELGRAILDRYAVEDQQMLERLWDQADRLSRDPLQQLLLFIGLYGDLDDMAADDPGCLFASFIYERQLGVEGAHEVIETAVRAWRTKLRHKLDEVVERYPPRVPVDLDALADLVYSVTEGAYVVARATHDPGLVRGQLVQVRNYIELLFAPPPIGSPTATV